MTKHHVIGVFYRHIQPYVGNWIADCSCGWEKSTIGARDAQRRALEHHRGATEPPKPVDAAAASRFLGLLRAREAHEVQERQERPSPGRS